MADPTTVKIELSPGTIIGTLAVLITAIGFFCIYGRQATATINAVVKTEPGRNPPRSTRRTKGEEGTARSPEPARVPNPKLRTVMTQSQATYRWWYKVPRFEALHIENSHGAWVEP